MSLESIDCYRVTGFIVILMHHLLHILLLALSIEKIWGIKLPSYALQITWRSVLSPRRSPRYGTLVRHFVVTFSIKCLYFKICLNFLSLLCSIIALKRIFRLVLWKMDFRGANANWPDNKLSEWLNKYENFFITRVAPSLTCGYKWTSFWSFLGRFS